MKFSLVFDNTNDLIPFEVVHNSDLIEWYINQADASGNNHFFNNDEFVQDVDQKLNDINWALSKTNEVYWLLSGEIFPQNDNVQDYLDQHFLNRQHSLWVESQYKIIDIDEFRFSSDLRKAEIGRRLHDLYPDEIRKIRMAEAMIKLGYIYAYEQVNKSVHHLETIFSSDREYSSTNKWADLGFDHPFVDTMVSNQDRVNLSFGYTYVGRQYYNKWQYWDTNLEFPDHYNYERLEWSFQLNLDRPQTKEWSPEFLQWCSVNQVRPIATQLPIANIIDLEKNLTYYRKMLYNNCRKKHAAKLILD